MSARVHGMHGDLVLPDWSPVTLEEVREVLAGYGLTARRIRWRSPRPLSAAAVVETSAVPVFVKRHALAVRTAAALAEEHAFADHLRAAGLPVPEVLADEGGHRAVEDGAWTWEVHAIGTGEDTYRDVQSWQPFTAAQHAFAVGASIAHVAVASRTFNAPARTPRLLVSSWGAVAAPELVPALDQFVEARPLLARALRGRDWRRDVEQVLVPLHARLVPHVPQLPAQWTHGDGHPSNFLWRGDRVSAVLDLGLSDRTTPLADLAIALERSCISWLEETPKARLDLVDALLAGWSSVTELDVAALAAVLPLVHVEFALSELAYFSGVTGSARNAELAYDGYLLGHARWFASAAGQELLRHMERRSRR